MILFFWLMVGHALADYPLQGDFLARAKCRCATSFPWQIALTAHAMIHAGFVAGLTGSIYLGLGELVLHWIIDYAKCEGWLMYFGPLRNEDAASRRALWIDQALHAVCKAAWAVLV